MMLPLENITVSALLRRTAARYPERSAVIFREKSYTYTQLDQMTDRFASDLIRLGVKKGDHVGIFGETAVETIALFYAIQRLGAVAVLLNTLLETDDLEAALRIADVEVLCVGSSYVKNRDLAAEVTGLKKLPALKKAVSYGSGASSLLPALSCGAETMTSAVREMEQAVQPSDTTAIIFTSGSTGAPKAVMTSHYSRVNNGIQQAHDFDTTCEDIFCVALPMFHCFCISANILAALSCGACLCIPDDRHTLSILKAIQTYRCTILHSVPSMFRAVMAREDFKSWDLSSLRTGIIGGSGYPSEDFDRIEQSFGMTLLSSLGQTEATAGLTISTPSDSRAKRCFTVGRFMDHVEGKIADIHSGKTLPAGQTGEICIRGYLVMQGFYGQPELTAKAIDSDGWLHTGDLAAMDDDGYLILQGRIKDLIIRGGENISPGEIETELTAFPEIAVCKVVGVPDAHYGEEVCACLVLKEGAALSAENIRAFLSGRLASYKIPKYILFFSSLPATATGKVRAKDTAALAAEKLGLAG